MSESVPQPSPEDYEALSKADVPAAEMQQGAELLARLRDAYEAPEFPQPPAQ
jgi:hypothetical protein